MKIIFPILVISILFLVVSSTSVSAREKEDKGPLTKITFIHYKKENNKPLVNTVGRPKTSSCYGFLASGAKWKTTEDYIVNPSNSGTTTILVMDSINNGVYEWEKYSNPNIFGVGRQDDYAQINENTVDGRNVVVFGNYPDSRVIAVTTIWGYFGGSPKTRELVEWDMLFNTYFHWGDATVDSSLMDVQNIATHELGHSAGMDDLYSTSCIAETMYGYSDYGEISKRDLNQGDIAGIQGLYR